jgi:hypothetical protein
LSGDSIQADTTVALSPVGIWYHDPQAPQTDAMPLCY